MIYRKVESLNVIGGSLILTLECHHQYSFIVNYFRYRPFPTNRDGDRIYRCRQCEDLQAKETSRRV